MEYLFRRAQQMNGPNRAVAQQGRGPTGPKWIPSNGRSAPMRPTGPLMNPLAGSAASQPASSQPASRVQPPTVTSFIAVPHTTLDTIWEYKGFIRRSYRFQSLLIQMCHFSQKHIFKFLECHFPPWFFAEGRRGLANKLENTLLQFRMSFSTRIFRRRPPRTSNTNLLIRIWN